MNRENGDVVRTSEHIGELAVALVKAQEAFPPIVKNKKAHVKAKSGAEYSYDYADLGNVLDAVRPVLVANDLAVLQPTAVRDGQTVLVTRLLHASGEWIEGDFPLQTYDRPQETGSALTYARRYALTALLNITAEEDDDAQAAQHSERKAPRTEAPEPNGEPDRIAQVQAVQRRKNRSDNDVAEAIAKITGKQRDVTVPDLTDHQFSCLLSELEGTSSGGGR